MFETLKNAWKVADIRRKIVFTAIVLIIFRIGSQIPVPFVDSAALKALFDNPEVSGSLAGYFNLLSGEAFSQATLFALSISPYITASIVIQLLTVAIPKWEQLSKSGPEGQEKLQKYTRILTMFLAIVLAYGYYKTIASNKIITNDNWFACLVVVASLTAGAYIVMWLGERIDEKGIGNGISMILFVNILSGMPKIAGAAITGFKNGFNGAPVYIFYVLLAIGIIVASIWFVIFVTSAERRLPVQYAKRQVGRRVYGGNSTFLPLKLNMNGVMPIIFAQSIVSIPATLGLIWPGIQTGVTDWFSQNSKFPFYALVYFVLIVGFGYFYSAISFNPVEVANNLQKNGGTMLGHRPGRQTSDYIKKTLNKVVFMGAIFLSIIAIFPILITMVYRITGAAITGVLTTIAFTGTSLLIVISVALETTRDIEAQMTMRHYKGFLE